MSCLRFICGLHDDIVLVLRNPLDIAIACAVFTASPSQTSFGGEDGISFPLSSSASPLAFSVERLRRRHHS